MATSRLRWEVLATLGLLLACLVPALVADPASAATGRVRGTITGQGADGAPKVKVLYFDQDWAYLGSRKAYGGGYSLSLPVGTYHLQFVDQRPAYDVTKYYPTDVAVTVTTGSTSIKNVRMRQGAAIGGTVRAGSQPAAGARVVAANTDRNSFEVRADKHGQYALGGLPPGTYSVFTYDRHRQWVGKSVYLRKLKEGSYADTPVRLTTQAGRLILDLYAGDASYPGRAFVTAVSRGNGQFWTARVRSGTVTLQGLYPGKYDLVVPAGAGFVADTVRVKGKVKSGRTSFGSARLTKRGGWVTGRVVDANDTSYPLKGASVTLLDGSGHVLDTAVSAADGTFVMGGELLTRGDLAVRAGPSPYSPYLGQGTHYCKYATATRSPVSVTTGAGTALGDLALPHLPDDQQDGAQCHTPPG